MHDEREADRLAGLKAQEAHRPRVPIMQGDLTTRTETRTCRDCETLFEGSVMYCGERPLFGVLRCPDCIAKHEAEKSAQTPVPCAQDARHAAFDAICPPEYRDSDTARMVAELNRVGSKPSRIGAGGLETIEIAQAVAEILAWEVWRKGLGLVGPAGHCKTRLMFAMLKPHVLAGRQVRAIHGAKLSRAMSAAYEDGARAAEAWLAEWAAVPILFLDDVDKSRFTESTLTDFYGLLEDRKAFERPTCFTSNATGKQLEERLRAEATRRGTEDTTGASLTRRLRAMASSYTI